MSWKVTAAHFYASESSKATGPFTAQTCEMVIYGLDADVALDLDNATGTFWTAAEADATYGTVAAAAYAALQKVQISAASLHSWGGNFALYRARGATPAAATIIMILGCTVTGELSLCTASTPIHNEIAISVAALMKAARTPARWYPNVLVWSAGRD